MSSSSNIINDQLPVRFLDKHSILPKRGTEHSAGLDLFSAIDISIPRRNRRLVSTGISVQLPDGSYGQVAARSSMAVKGIDVGAGVIDSDYRGEIKVLLVNNTDSDYQVYVGDKIAQLIVLPYIRYLVPIQVSTLDETQRGNGGFGSTGN